MLFRQLGRAHWLRETVGGIRNYEGKLKYPGITAPSRSALAYANKASAPATLPENLPPHPLSLPKPSKRKEEVLFEINSSAAFFKNFIDGLI